MPCNAILSVELLGIHTIEPGHAPGEDPFGCLDKKVIVLCGVRTYVKFILSIIVLSSFRNSSRSLSSRKMYS